MNTSNFERHDREIVKVEIPPNTVSFYVSNVSNHCVDDVF